MPHIGTAVSWKLNVGHSITGAESIAVLQAVRFANNNETLRTENVVIPMCGFKKCVMTR